MILTLNVHHSRVSDLAQPDHMRTTPSVPTAAYRDGFGNWCTRLVAPAGHFRVTSDATVNDTGAPEPVVAVGHSAPRPAAAGGDAGLPAGKPLLRDRQDVPVRLGPVLQRAARLGARAGDLRLRPPAHPVRLPVRQPDQDRLGGLQRAQGRLPRLRPPGHHALPLHEHSRALLHRLSGRHRSCPRTRRRWTSPAGSRPTSGATWYTFDPRNNVPRIGRVLIARGRDAADVAITTTFGPNTLQSFRVWTDEVSA